jgi:hypothetical protein
MYNFFINFLVYVYGMYTEYSPCAHDTFPSLGLDSLYASSGEAIHMCTRRLHQVITQKARLPSGQTKVKEATL